MELHSASVVSSESGSDAVSRTVNDRHGLIKGVELGVEIGVESLDNSAVRVSSSGIVCSKFDAEPVLMVFDELDAHVGGEAAAAIARLLRQQGRYRQVIAVTHNPVIAAAADRHFLVRKQRTTSVGECSVVEEVSGDKRIAEIARMTTGKHNDKHSVELAKELLRQIES